MLSFFKYQLTKHWNRKQYCQCWDTSKVSARAQSYCQFKQYFNISHCNLNHDDFKKAAVKARMTHIKKYIDSLPNTVDMHDVNVGYSC